MKRQITERGKYLNTTKLTKGLSRKYKELSNLKRKKTNKTIQIENRSKT